MSTQKQPALTLEQQRAADCWQHVQKGVPKDYVNVAKAMPGFIMNSGLMQTLAFAEQKGGHYKHVAAQLRAWLGTQVLKTRGDPGFEAMLNILHSSADSATVRLMTTEALAWLKWLRQLAPAQQRDDNRG